MGNLPGVHPHTDWGSQTRVACVINLPNSKRPLQLPRVLFYSDIRLCDEKTADIAGAHPGHVTTDEQASTIKETVPEHIKLLIRGSDVILRQATPTYTTLPPIPPGVWTLGGTGWHVLRLK